MGWVQGKLAESWIQMETLSRFFLFQVLNVFLVTTVAGFAVEVQYSKPFEAIYIVVYINFVPIVFSWCIRIALNGKGASDSSPF